jgi:hypothetical protein
VSIRLNDLFNQIADNCLELTQLALADCFTSLHDVPIPHTAVMRLDQFGQPLPLVLLKHIQSMSTINTLQSLELSGIHGLTIGHLAQVILRCPFLERLILKRSLVNIIPVLNIIYSGYCQKLKYLLFERNRYCRHTDQYQHHQQQQQQTMVIPLLMRPSSHTALHSTKRAWIELEIVATSQLSDQIMRRLIHDKSRLSVLNLQGNSQLSDEAFRFNDNDTTQLRRLGLKECYGITSKGLYALIAHSPLLEHVDLSCLSIVTGEIIRLLAQCPHLRTLNLSYCRLFCFDELKELIDKKQDTLEQLKIEYTNIPLDMVAFKARKIKKGII